MRIRHHIEYSNFTVYPSKNNRDNRYCIILISTNPRLLGYIESHITTIGDYLPIHKQYFWAKYHVRAIPFNNLREGEWKIFS